MKISAARAVDLAGERCMRHMGIPTEQISAERYRGTDIREYMRRTMPVLSLGRPHEINTGNVGNIGAWQDIHIGECRWRKKDILRGTTGIARHIRSDIGGRKVIDIGGER